MIARDPRGAQEAQHDLIVIGGGIYGCMLALEAARCGLQPVLVERDDFGQHTSGSWLRIVHGGLRYLQTFDLRRHVEAVRERRWFLRHLPELVRPLPCLMPLYGRGVRSRPILGTALAVNDLMSLRRNSGLRADRRLPAGRIVTAEEVLQRAPAVEAAGLVGGALWHDAFTPHPQRVLMELLHEAARMGAHALNYVEAMALLQAGGRVAGVVARDRVSGGELSLRARAVVSCAGPWSADVAERLDRPAAELFRPSFAFNVLFDRALELDGALAVTADRPGARTYFLLAAHGGVLAGTYHAPVANPTAEVAGPDPEMVARFARELDEAVPQLGLAAATPRHVFWGQLPVQREGTVALSTREVIRDHGARGGPDGLFTVSGVKYTVARAVAVRTLRALQRRGLCRAPRAPEGLSTSPRYVPDAQALLALVDQNAAAAGDIVRRIAQEEAARGPEDVLWRRTSWALDARDPEARARLERFVAGALREVQEPTGR